MLFALRVKDLAPASPKSLGEGAWFACCVVLVLVATVAEAVEAVGVEELAAAALATAPSRTQIGRP